MRLNSLVHRLKPAPPRAAKFFVVIFYFCAAMILWAQTPGRGVISGIVVDSLNNEPVRKAIVTVTRQGTPRAWGTMRTDSSGEFRFEGLPVGKYDLRATREGIGTAGELLSLEDGETRAGVKLLFVRFATISGRVADPEGDPARGVSVTLLRLSHAQVADRQGVTDDRGEYRIEDVPPGQYYVHANPPSTKPSLALRASGAPEARTIPQFFGGSRTSNGATVLNIRSGENREGIDFNLTAEPPGRIHGHVIAASNSVSLYELGAVVITIKPIEDNVEEWFNAQTVLPPDYEFNFADLAPSRYRLESLVQHDSRVWAASQIVDTLSAGDTIVALAPAPDIQGSLHIEGPSHTSASGFEIRLSSVSAKVSADGRFKLAQVPPGEWRLGMEAPPGSFVKSVRLGDKEVRYEPLEIDSGSQPPLNITISMNAAQIYGESDARAGILLAPSGEYRAVESLYYTAATDGDGKFTLTGIAPGKYKIFALEKLSADEFRTPEAADQLDPLGEEVDLAEGASVEVHPKLVPMERAREALP